MLSDPFVAFRPQVSFFHIKSLFGQRGPARRHLLLCAGKRTENPVQNKKI